MFIALFRRQITRPVEELLAATDRLQSGERGYQIESTAGNREFEIAEGITLESLHELHLEEVETFLEEFLPAYEKTLDEIQTGVLQ